MCEVLYVRAYADVCARVLFVCMCGCLPVCCLCVYMRLWCADVCGCVLAVCVALL